MSLNIFLRKDWFKGIVIWYKKNNDYCINLVWVNNVLVIKVRVIFLIINVKVLFFFI